eukprot:10017_4
MKTSFCSRKWPYAKNSNIKTSSSSSERAPRCRTSLLLWSTSNLGIYASYRTLQSTLKRERRLSMELFKEWPICTPPILVFFTETNPQTSWLMMYSKVKCDFGFARVKVSNRTMTKCGTMTYEAPEIMKGQRYDEKADVYSFGILLWEIEAREPPYRGENDPLGLQFRILNGL